MSAIWLPSGFKKQIESLVLEIAHNKRNRCLALVEVCNAKIDYWHIRCNIAAGYSRNYEKWKHKLFIKWRKRWQELAKYYEVN